MRKILFAFVSFFLVSCGGDYCQEVNDAVGIWQRVVEPPLPVTTIEITQSEGEGCGLLRVYDHDSGKELIVFDASSGFPAFATDPSNDFQQKMEIQVDVLVISVFDPNGQLVGKEVFQPI